MNTVELIRTPMVEVPSPTGVIHIKDESLQVTGAFKIRGVRAKLLQTPGRGPVCTASTGNHGAAVAKVAKILDRPAVIFVPFDTPATKTARIESCGAELIRIDGDYTACSMAAQEWARLHRADYIPSFDDLAIIAGHTTLFHEIREDMAEEPTYVWVPVGGGGLLSASVLSFSPSTRIIGVELEGADAMRQSLAAHQRLTVQVPRGVAEGLCVRQVGELPFRIASLANVPIVTVSVEQLEDAVRQLWQAAGIRTELAGAAAFAAALHYGDRLRGTSVAIASGGNIDSALFDRIIGPIGIAA